MGTTRMHENPRLGVVDANCRVHGLGNHHAQAGILVHPRRSHMMPAAAQRAGPGVLVPGHPVKQLDPTGPAPAKLPPDHLVAHAEGPSLERRQPPVELRARHVQRIAFRAEQDSRVLLSTERDALDMPRAKLDWRLTALERRSFRVRYEVIGRELGRSGAGRVQLLDWVTRDEDTWPGTLSGGWHHMGTTRMHENPRLGVVDANCRVHGLGNRSEERR